ncbi:peptidoglycan-binding protein [Spirillospora sp. NPDC048911]|uniref:peptidoglycan-binding domain-containing protein n=1 Tax=Spirillospora sp. NPDC048911 TaxID=3364527 RepID=UPI00370FA670
MKIKRVAIAGLAAAGIVVGGTAIPASADTHPYSNNGLGPHPILRYGQVNENVRALQWMLNCEGHTLKTPSRFGPQTLQAVKNLQAKHHVDQGADGNVGAATWHSLYMSSASTRHGSKNDCVKAVQVLLNKWKYNDDLPITGYQGDRTTRKLQRFQKEHGQAATGYADHDTFHKLIYIPAGK